MFSLVSVVQIPLAYFQAWDSLLLFFFFNFLNFILFIYLFILNFWLRRFLVVACGIFVAAPGLFVAARRLPSIAGFLSGCGAQAPEHMGSVVCGTRAL